MNDPHSEAAPPAPSGGAPEEPAAERDAGDPAARSRSDAGSAAAARQRKARWFAALVVATGVALVAALVVWSRGPVGVVRGQAPAGSREVVLTDPARGVLVQGTLEAAGAFRVSIPAGAHEPLVVFHGEGESLVRSGVLAPAPEVEAPALELWSTPIRARQDADRLRFDWAPVPRGAGYPGVTRYSLLFRFRAADGEWAEASLLSAEPEVELPRNELRDLLRNAGPDVREVTVELRSFDPSQPEGPLWVATQRTWPLPWVGEAEATD